MTNITLHTVIVAQALKITRLEEEVAELTHNEINHKATIDYLKTKIEQCNETIQALKKEKV